VKDKNEMRPIFLSLGLGVLASILFSVDGFGLLFLMVLPAIYVSLALKYGIYYACAAYLTSLAALWLMHGVLYAMIFGLLMLPPIWVLSYFLRKPFSFQNVLAVCGSFLAGFALLFAAVYFLTGKDVITALVDYAHSAFLTAQPGSTAYSYMVTLGYFDSYLDLPSGLNDPAFIAALNGTTLLNKVEYAQRAISQMQQMLQVAMAPGLLTYAMLGGLLSYVVSYGLLRKAKVSIPALPSFSRWTVPPSFRLAALAMLVLSYVGTELSATPSIIMAMNLVYLFCTMVFLVLGCSVCVYLLNRALKDRKVLPVVISIFLVLIASTIVILLGVIELAFNIRQRIDKNTQQ
jgi:hypothetical protein